MLSGSGLDRRLVGVIAIALVLSTILFCFLFLRRAAEPVTVIRNVAPAQLVALLDFDETHRFSLGLVVRKKIQELTIQYSFFSAAQTSGLPEVLSFEAWEANLSHLALQERLLEQLGFEPEKVQGQLSIDGRSQEYLLYDMGRAMCALTSWQLAGDATSSYILLPAEANATLMKGRMEFYYYIYELAKITITRGGNETVYRALKRGEEFMPGERPISEAPVNGRIRFENLKPDEPISVMIELRGWTGHGRCLSLIRIYVDGKLEKVLAKFMNWAP